MTPLAKSIHAILFATAEPQTLSWLATRLGVDKDAVTTALDEIAASCEESGLMLVHDGATATLGTRPEEQALIADIRKEELSKELTKASAETLAIIAYTPGISRAQIEFIRGVNVSYTLRSLLIRGLIESRTEGKGAGYYPTVELLRSFGIADTAGLPEYADTRAKIEKLLSGDQEPALL